MTDELLLKKVLQDHSHKLTHPRLKVFRVFQNGQPQTIAELITALDGTVNRVTVYRIIDLFEQLGVVKRIPIGWKYKLELGELFARHHHHITCLSCGNMVTIHEDKIAESLIRHLGKGSGFIITAHQLELQGYCKDCQTKVAS